MQRFILGLLAVLMFAAADQRTGAPPVKKTPRAVDSTRAVRAVTGFLRWYKIHIDSSSRIILVRQRPQEPYSVDLKKGEQYLAHLRSSGFLTEAYLGEWRQYFRDRNEGFRAHPQTEGPPLGFEYDLVLLSQDVDQQLKELSTLKINEVSIRKDRATVQFTLLFEYEIRLRRQNNRWVINEILNLSAE